VNLNAVQSVQLCGDYSPHQPNPRTVLYIPNQCPASSAVPNWYGLLRLGPSPAAARPLAQAEGGSHAARRARGADCPICLRAEGPNGGIGGLQPPSQLGREREEARRVRSATRAGRLRSRSRRGAMTRPPPTRRPSLVRKLRLVTHRAEAAQACSLADKGHDKNAALRTRAGGSPAKAQMGMVSADHRIV